MTWVKQFALFGKPISQEKKSLLIMLALVACVVILFNLIAIFGLNALLHDDPKHYKDAIEGRIYFGAMKYFLLWPFTEFFAWKLMAFSSHLTRGLYVTFLMVPLSWCFYYLYHNKFRLPRIFAFVAAVMPNILPHQWQIPAGINMSRTIYPLLIIMVAVIMGLHYLEKKDSNNRWRWVASVFLYLIACQMMEQALFLLPPLLLIFWGYTRLNKKHYWLIISYSIIGGLRLLQMILFTRKPRFFAPIDEIFRRFTLYFKYSLPSWDIEPLLLAIFYIGIILAGFVLSLGFLQLNSHKNTAFFSHLNNKTYIIYIYAFFIGWAVSSILPFIVMGGIIFPPRYSYISGFGINAAFLFSLSVIINTLTSKLSLNKIKPQYILLIGILVFSGMYRYENLKQIFNVKNNVHSIIERDLKKLNLPKNSQVVITNLPQMAHGRKRASGYLMHALKRNDIRGVFATVATHEPNNFYDHFNPAGITAINVFNFHGIYYRPPIFFFSLKPEQERLEQRQYILDWKGRTKNAPWRILKMNKKKGTLSTFQAGSGMKEYVSVINQVKEQGIDQRDILWGGPPSRKELNRLNQLKLDPTLFQFGFYYYSGLIKKINANVVDQFKSILTEIAPLAQYLNFEDSISIEAILLDDVTDPRGVKTQILHFLGKSNKTQNSKNIKLELTLLHLKKGIGRFRNEFHKNHYQLKSGDYFLGNFKILDTLWQKADQIGIRLIYPGKPSQQIYLKIKGVSDNNPNS